MLKDPLIFDIIKVGIQLEVSNKYSIFGNEVKIKLSDGTEVNISTDFII